MKTTNEEEVPLCHSPEGAARRLSVSVRAIYRLIAEDQLRSFKVGKRRLISEQELQRFVTSLDKK